MSTLILHEHTISRLTDFASRPAHAVLIVGPSGIGKTSISFKLAADLLQIDQEAVRAYPYLHHIVSLERKAIGIEAVRELEHFLTLKIPSSKPVARIAIIEDAHLLTHEAQNALLKTLEEPPMDTILILTTSTEQALLPTIRSRLQSISVKKPKLDALRTFFEASKDVQRVSQALAVSGGLPGLTTALLDEQSEHPLVEAVKVAREILQASTYERLIMVDRLSKRKELCQDMCFVLLQMAQVALQRGGQGQTRWQAVLTAAHEAEKQLLGNGQTKLILTSLMLSL